MKALLLETVESLGKLGNIKNIKRGYVRNYLLPKGKIIIINKKNINFYIKQKNSVNEKQKHKIFNNIQTYNKIKEMHIEFKKKTLDNERIYGVIGKREIITKIRKIDNTIQVYNKDIINLKNNIHTIGTYEIIFSLSPGPVIFYKNIVVSKST